MQYRSTKELQLIDSLKEKGFSEELILRALQRSGSYDEEVIVDCIVELMNNPEIIEEQDREKEKLLEQIKERKLEQQRDKEYLERIRQRIAENRMDKPKIILDQSEIQKTAPVFGECTVKIRYNDKSEILHLNKSDTIEALRNKVMDAFGLSKFKMSIFKPYRELSDDNETMEQVGLVPNGVVLIE